MWMILRMWCFKRRLEPRGQKSTVCVRLQVLLHVKLVCRRQTLPMRSVQRIWQKPTLLPVRWWNSPACRALWVPIMLARQVKPSKLRAQSSSTIALVLRAMNCRNLSWACAWQHPTSLILFAACLQSGKALRVLLTPSRCAVLLLELLPCCKRGLAYRL